MIVYPNVSIPELLDEELELTEIFKDFAVRFQWLLQYDPIADILNITETKDISLRQAVDWSSKLDQNKDLTIEYTLKNFAQNNTLTFKNSSDNPDGDFTFTLQDQKAKLQENAYQNIFAYPKLFNQYIFSQQFTVKEDASGKEVGQLLDSDFDEQETELFTFVDKFQFLYGTIKVQQNFQNLGHYIQFQFLYGTIKVDLPPPVALCMIMRVMLYFSIKLLNSGIS